MNGDTDYMTTGEAAALLRLSARTLERYRPDRRRTQVPQVRRPGALSPRRCRGVGGGSAGETRPPTTARNTRGARTRRSAERSPSPPWAFRCWPCLPASTLPWASTDTTFQGPLDTVSGMVSGTGGQLAAALAVGAALVGSVLKFNAMQLLGAVGVGVAAGAGVGIVTGIVGTAIV